MQQKENLPYKHSSIYALLALALLALVGFGLHWYETPKTKGFSTKPEHQEFYVGIPGSGQSMQGKVKLPILMYHHIGPVAENADQITKDLTVSSEDFEQQVAWIKSQGFTSVNLEQVANYTKGTEGLPQKPIVFTFDDGYQDSFTYAIPILKKYGYTGSFALITSWQGTQVGTNTYATWNVVQSAKNDGMEMVCHTQNHFDGSNPKFDANYIFNNLSGCKKDLNDHGITTDVLIYPYGHFTEGYIQQAEKAGFTLGLTTEAGDMVESSDLMKIPRIRIHGHQNFEKFKELLNR